MLLDRLEGSGCRRCTRPRAITKFIWRSTPTSASGSPRTATMSAALAGLDRADFGGEAEQVGGVDGRRRIAAIGVMPC